MMDEKMSLRKAKSVVKALQLCINALHPMTGWTAKECERKILKADNKYNSQHRLEKKLKLARQIIKSRNSA
jgi:hypothetical protein